MWRCASPIHLRGRTSRPASFAPADFAYVRLRGTGYDTTTLEGWGTSFRSALEEGIDVYCYLKHEDSAAGPRDAAILQRMAGAAG